MLISFSCLLPWEVVTPRYLILPSYDKNGELNFYVSRNIDADTANSFKYKNANVSKNKIIFNEINIDWNIPLTLVEGPLDLLKTNDNATCLLGSALNEEMLLFQQIVKNKHKNISKWYLIVKLR